MEEEVLFYIKEFNTLTNKKASNFLILYMMTLINNFFDIFAINNRN